MILFDVENVPIQGKNLVEASAGTGKTYSIAIMVLRAIIESEPPKRSKPQEAPFLSIEDLLIVTYTKAAVAELQERIRLFLKLALDAAQGRNISDKTISRIVQNQLNKEENQFVLIEKIKHSLFNLDEANILTIHGFSQKMLSEFAFETRQPFQATVQNDIEDILIQYANEFYRKEITNLPIPILQHWKPVQFKNDLPKIFRWILAGFQFVGPSTSNSRTIENIQSSILEGIDKLENTKTQIHSFLEMEKEAIISDIETIPANSRKPFLNNIHIPEEFIAIVLSKKDTKYFQKFTHPIFSCILSLMDDTNHLENALLEFEYELLHKAIEIYIPKIKHHIEHNSILTFDAMIHNLRSAIIQSPMAERLKLLIRNKFKIVFIDEFQDTDRVQFEIFDHLFIQSIEHTLFLIGDPKQSIYGFRNADINSYLEAKSRVENIYSMNTNFRSTTLMVQAINDLYQELGVDKAFGYESSSEELSIQYEIVTTPPMKAQWMCKGKIINSTLEFYGFDKSPLAQTSLAEHISHLLDPQNGYTIIDKKSGIERPLTPSDIGVLVSQKKQGQYIKNKLQNLNIPAVQIMDEKVLQTQQCLDIQWILEAFIKPDIHHIRKVLYLTFIQIHLNESHEDWLFAIDENEALELFSTYNELIQQNQVYQAFAKLFEDFSVRQLLANSTQNLRILSNLEQILQLIHEYQYRTGKNSEDILLWLQHSYQGLQHEGDAYITQIESDEEAVKIVTIHSSKGLEYNIVFIYGIHVKPSLDTSFHKWITFKQGELHTPAFTRSIHLDEAAQQDLLLEWNREQCRLIYVALTRSVYACAVYYPNSQHPKVGFKGSYLEKMIQSVENSSSPHLQSYVDRTYPSAYYRSNIQEEDIKPISFDMRKARASRSKWWKMSFSALSLHEPMVYERREVLEPNDYDNFIFERLPRGTQVGTLLHTLFENLDFSIDYSPSLTIHWYYNKQFDAFAHNQWTDSDAENLKRMVMHTLKAKIHFPHSPPFTLSEIQSLKKLNELEFNFHVNVKEDFESLKSILESQGAKINYWDTTLEGMMTGFIDLFFEHQGRYYILDWKSNYLGNDLEAYKASVLFESMKDHNYHLQHLIYTVAAYKYLKSRIPDISYEKHMGGVIYVFLRGTRAHTDYGIFTHLPSEELIVSLAQIFN